MKTDDDFRKWLEAEKPWPAYEDMWFGFRWKKFCGQWPTQSMFLILREEREKVGQ